MRRFSHACACPGLQDGKYLKKKNTFTDVVASAEHLIAENYTSKDKLCIQASLVSIWLHYSDFAVDNNIFLAFVRFMGCRCDAQALLWRECIAGQVCGWLDNGGFAEPATRPIQSSHPGRAICRCAHNHAG